jgi:helix-turn-helix protein
MSDFSKLVWLKRSDGHRFTGAELRVLLSIFNHSGSDGQKSHPGIKRMMDETGYGKAAVSTAVSSLKARGWIRETYRGSGVSGNASVFELVPDAPNPPGSSPGGEQPNDGSSSSRDEQLSESSSPTAGGCSPVGDGVVHLEANPSDPSSDPKRSDPLGGREDRPSDPVQVRYPPNHVFDPFEVSDFEGSARQQSCLSADPMVRVCL